MNHKAPGHLCTDASLASYAHLQLSDLLLTFFFVAAVEGICRSLLVAIIVLRGHVHMTSAELLGF